MHNRASELTLRFYIGRDKGKATIVVALDLDNAQTMVDASTKLYFFFALTGNFSLEHQGKIKLDKYNQEDAEYVLDRLIKSSF